MGKRGQVLVGIIMLLLVITTLLPVLIYYSQTEAKWSVKASRATHAFHLAEAGIEKAVFAISISTANWQTLKNGGRLDHYHFDTPYTDIAGGTYTIDITSGPQNLQVTVLSIGRDSTTQEVRAIKAIYTSGIGVNAGIYASGITIGGGPIVEWGPMMSLANIALSGSSDVCSPQKYAVGTITGMSAACHANAPGSNYGGTSPPCTDNAEWWVYNCSPGVPPSVGINVGLYTQLAQAASCPTATYPAGASPAQSCYWPVGQNPTFNGIIDTSSRTYYVEGDLTLRNGYTWGDIIVNGNLTLSGSGAGPVMTITPPATAWQHYKKIDTAAVGEYPGDNGYQSVVNSFTFNVSGGKTPAQCPHAACQTGTKNALAARGFVYVGGTITGAGGSDVYGVLYSPNSVSGLSGNTGLWYDPDVGSGINLASSAPTRVSWQEILSPWPSWLP